MVLPNRRGSRTAWPRPSRSGFANVALFDEEVVDFAGLVHVDLDERAGLCQPEAALPPALVQQGLLVLQVRPRHQPHHLAQLIT